MPKITLLGAGSTVFAKRLLVDILSFPELAGSTISLHDIDPERLRTSEVVAHKVAEAVGAHIEVADRDIRTTLSRAWRIMGFWNKIKLLFQMYCLP